MSKPKVVYSLNPSVDVYKIGDNQLEFYFITTRRRITLQVSPLLISVIMMLDGNRTLEDVGNILAIDYQGLDTFLSYLHRERILVNVHDERNDMSYLSEGERNRYDRQISYFKSSYQLGGCLSQQKLKQARVAIFGLGAVGSGIALELAMAGVENFVLIDMSCVTESNVERHFTFSKGDVGAYKVDAVSRRLQSINPHVRCLSYTDCISYDTDISKYLDGASFVVNTLDEPYIGLTSAKIGRLCLALKLPMFVAGGFDAHLMSTGELILPGETPCVDCYLSHFTEALSDWKPKYNTVREASSSPKLSEYDFRVGGLSSMSLFSISYAVMVIIDYIASGRQIKNTNGRGECLFEDLNISYINVARNPECLSCKSI